MAIVSFFARIGKMLIEYIVYFANKYYNCCIKKKISEIIMKRWPG